LPSFVEDAGGGGPDALVLLIPEEAGSLAPEAWLLLLPEAGLDLLLLL